MYSKITRKITLSKVTQTEKVWQYQLSNRIYMYRERERERVQLTSGNYEEKSILLFQWFEILNFFGIYILIKIFFGFFVKISINTV